MTSCFYIMSLRIIATRKWRVLKVTPTGGNTGGGVCGLWLPCCCDGSTDDFSLIIYVGVAVAAAFAVLLVIFCIIWSTSSAEKARPSAAASPVVVSSRPAARHQGTAPAHLRSHGYRNNGYRGNECSCARRNPNTRCFYARSNVYSDHATPF